MQSRPENFCKKWTPMEESQVLSKSVWGVSVKTIAKQHGRTVGGIRSRLQKIAVVLVSEGKTMSEAARLTGLRASQIIAQVQKSGKTDSVPVAHVVPTMNFSTTHSRAELQAIPAKRRLEAIQRYVDQHVDQPVRLAATLGKTSYLFVIQSQTNNFRTRPIEYVVTPDDIVDGLQIKFPGCGIQFSEEWVETRPGVREHRTGILIDWS